MELVLLDSAVLLVNAWQVDLGVEHNLWRSLWVVFAAGDRHHVDAVVEVGVWWPDDRAIPVCERFVVACIQVRHRLTYLHSDHKTHFGRAAERVVPSPALRRA